MCRCIWQMWASLSVMSMKNDKKYQIIPYPSEYVVEDMAGKRIVSCPTEQEAREYIEEFLEGEAVLFPIINGGMDSED